MQGQSRLLGDMAVLIKAVGACEADGQMERFCIKHSMRYKALQEIRKLRSQLTRNGEFGFIVFKFCVWLSIDAVKLRLHSSFILFSKNKFVHF